MKKNRYKIFIMISYFLIFSMNSLFSENLRKIYCPYCGTKIEKNDSYCPNCTMPLKRIFKYLKNHNKFKHSFKYSPKLIKPILNSKISKENLKIVKELIDHAQKSIRKKEFQGCENFARAILKIDRNSYIAYYLIAQSYFKRKNYNEAMKNIVESLKINPLHRDSIYLGKRIIKVLKLR